VLHSHFVYAVFVGLSRLKPSKTNHICQKNMQHTQRKHRRASLNHNFRLVWSEAQQMFVAVAEICRGQGKAKSTVAAAVTALLLGTGAAYAQALPTGGQVTAGQASISANGAVMNIDQTSHRAAINWNTFNIGAGGTVNFNQPNASAVTLNRVVGNERSVIDGALNANGSVWILNSQGVLFNSNAQVNVGSLVATTLNMSDEAFMAGSTTFEGNGGPGSVINLGTLSAANEGHIALLGQHVANEGVINATLGSAILAAGDKVSLNFNGNSLVGVTIERGVLNALVENKQAIIADGGLVTLTAKGLDEVMRTVVNNTGEVRAQSIEEREGRIFLLGGMENDRIEVSGRLDASAPNGGNGGFIETSAANVQIRDGVQVTTRATQGRTGQWLIDPTDFNIVSGSGSQTSSSIGATTLSDNLGNTDVIIQTVASGTENGDINVNADVVWNSGNKLTLEAHGNINVNALISAGDESSIDLKTGYNFDTLNPQFDSTKSVRMLWDPITRTFIGRIIFPEDGGTWIGGPGYLSINGEEYTLLRSFDENVLSNSLGSMASGLNGLFALAGNIDGTNFDFIPVGDADAPFTGKFIGLGNTINNLTISKPDDENVGLFGVTDGATISNVSITNASVNGYDSVGILIGRATGTTVDNSHAHDVAVGNLSVGGLIGTLEDNSILRHSSAAVNVIGVRPDESPESVAYLGGLVGYLYDSTIEDSRASGSVRVVGDAGDEVGAIGGLVGEAYGSTIRRSTASGNVEGGYDDENIPIGEYVGGLVGFADGVSIENSSASGSVTGRNGVGGLVGNLNYDSSISSSHATGAVNGVGQVGGLVGYMGAEASITDSYSESMVEGATDVGGLVGLSEGNSSTKNTITGSYHQTGTVEGLAGVGGLVGVNFNTDITDSYATSDVTGLQAVGGLVGYTEGSIITSSRAEGDVEGEDTVGGLVGLLGANSTVESSSSSSNVTATGNEVGGLVGAMNFWLTYIDDSSATGTVLGNKRVGGLVGATNYGWTLISPSWTGKITNSHHTTGTVTGVDAVGGLVGLNTGRIEDSYATSHVVGTSTEPDSPGGVGGFVGANLGNGDIVRGYATGNVTAAGYFAGGFVGTNTSSSSIGESFATGIVQADHRAGGFAGTNTASLYDVFALGGVSATSDVAGGLVGDNLGYITNSYSAGTVAAPTNRGGLVGSGWGMAFDSYWDVTSSGIGEADSTTGSAAGVGKTTAQLRQLSTFPVGDGVEIQGWDIVADSALTGVRPQLRWATTGLGLGNSVWVIGTVAGTGNGGTATDPAPSSNLQNQVAAAINSLIDSGQFNSLSNGLGSGAFGGVLPPAFGLVFAPAQGPVSGADGQQTPGNVIVATPSLTLPFTDPGELMMVGTPNPGDPANVVSLSEARQMMGDGQTEGEREVRVPVSRNSLAQIVNGGVRLPGGVDQKLFVVRK
jgi:filamentous hemagglutinin family protein